MGAGGGSKVGGGAGKTRVSDSGKERKSEGAADETPSTRQPLLIMVLSVLGQRKPRSQAWASSTGQSLFPLSSVPTVREIGTLVALLVLLLGRLENQEKRHKAMLVRKQRQEWGAGHVEVMEAL